MFTYMYENVKTLLDKVLYIFDTKTMMEDCGLIFGMLDFLLDENSLKH